LQEIIDAIKKMLHNKQQYMPDHDLLMQKFSYTAYKNNIKSILNSLQN